MAVTSVYLVFAALLTAVCPVSGADVLEPLSSASSQPPVPWHVSGLPRQTKPFTRFSIEDWLGQRALRVEADRSYGNLLHTLAPTVQFHHLSWRWVVDEPNPLADIRERGLEDVTVRVCVLFDLSSDRIPFIERQLLSLQRLRSSDPVPGAAACYVWDARLAPGTIVESPYTRRIRFMVLRGPEGRLQQWTLESRDIEADFRRLFGDESKEMPPVIGVTVGADTDNTQRHTLAHVTALSLAP
ncbi:MAG TPA: DUF3047 domain-containing protein [Burkholderiaceae bacterium]|nr:DUF3047 domain-containing protein [Burkholderiaceae bacterium]